MRGIRKWLWMRCWDLADIIATPDVREKQREVMRLGMAAYHESRKVKVQLREDLR